MKNIRILGYLIFLSLVLTGPCFSQLVGLELQSTDNANKNIPLSPGINNFVARDLVKVKAPSDPNSWTGIAPNSSSSAYLKTDNTIVPPLIVSGSTQPSNGVNNSYQPVNTSGAYTINTGLDVGYTPGAASVTPMGAASYSIPLDLPFGAQGMKPNLSIVYNSQARNGLLGWGWELAGLSAIRRAPFDYYSNGEVGTLWSGDYALDGNRLVTLSSSNPNVYGTQNERFSTITRTNGTGNQPDIFVLQDKQGSYTEYGRGNSKVIPKNGTNPTEWWINKESDVNGNSIKYDYILDDGSIRINRIDYTINDAAGGSAPYSIVFFYDERDDKRIGLYPTTDGTLISWESKLVMSKITIMYNNSPIKSYKLDYSYDGKMTKLNSVTEIAGDGRTQLNPTKILWENYSSQIGGTLQFAQNTDQYTNQYSDIKRMLSGDINGDGLNDLVLLRESNITILQSASDLSFVLIDNDITYYPDYYTDGSRDYVNFELFDVDYDGKQELVRFQMTNFYHTGSYGSLIVKDYDSRLTVYKYNPQTIKMTDVTQQISITLNENPSISAVAATDFYSPMLIKGDYDGNGQLDFIVFHPIEGGHIGSYNFTLANSANFGDGGYTNFYSAIDIDADGKSEILGAKKYSHGYIPANFYKISKNGSVTSNYTNYLSSSEGFEPMYRDFNADGMTDVLVQVYVNQQYKLKLFFGNGSDFKEVNGWSNAFTLSNMPTTNILNDYETYWQRNTIQVADVNYDGFMDLVAIIDDNITDTDPSNDTRFLKAFVQSNGTFIETVGKDIKYLSINTDGGSIWVSTYIKGQSIWGDFNADLTLDFLNIDAFGRIGRYDLNFGYSTNLNSITDGFGRESRFTYDIINGDINTNGRNLWYAPPTTQPAYPYSNFLGPLRIVKRLDVPDGLGGTNSTTYGYDGGTLSLQGKGFLGFSKFRVVDVANNIEYATEYQTNSDQSVSVTSKTKSLLIAPVQIGDIPTRNIISSEDYITNTYLFPLSTRSFTYTSEITNNNYLTGVQSIVTYDYDETLGELKSVSTVNSDQQNTIWDSKTTEIYSTGPYGANNAYRRLSDVTTKSQKYGGAEYSQVVTYEYTTDGKNLLRILDGSSTSYLSKTEYSYTGNPFGKATRVTRHADDVPDDRIENFTYDVNGINMSSHTLANGALHSYIYSPSMGLLSQSIAPGGLTTEYRHDIWGRIIKTTYPDRTEANVIYAWENSEPNARYKVENQSTGSAPAILYYDIWDRPIKGYTSSMNGPTGQDQIYVQKSYNTKGQLTGVSSPYESGVTPKMVNYSYDIYGRASTVIDMTNPTLGTALTTTFEYPTLPVSGRNFVKAVLPLSEDGSDRYSKTTYTSEGLAEGKVTPAGTTTIKYHGSGQLDNVMNNTFKEKYHYDDNGNMWKVEDPYKGTDTYSYNKFRELTGGQHTKPLSNTVVNTVVLNNTMGQVTSASIGDAWRLAYTYEPAGSPAAGQVSSVSASEVVSSTNDVVSNVKYDNLGRISEKSETFRGKTYTQSYTYDVTTGKVSTITYPNHLTLTYHYHPQTGELYQISSNKPSKNGFIWQVKAQDASGKQLTSGSGYVAKTTMLGNGLLSIINYDDNHNFARISTGSDANGDGVLESLTFYYSATSHPNTGNTVARQSYKRSSVENATYDDMGRVKEVWEQPAFGLPKEHPRYTFTYDARGNMGGLTEKNINNGSVVSDYSYHTDPTSAIPDQLQSVDQNQGVIPIQEQTISYTDFNKVSRIRDNGYVLDFVYGPDMQRRLMTETGPSGSNYQKKTSYFGDYEFETDGGDITQVERSYIWGPDGLVAVLINDPAHGGEKMYYAHTDHLGSVLMLTDANGSVAEEYSYDVWGRRRDPLTWQYYNTANPQPSFKLTRGFTFHEHLDRYGLVNMNGRLYDPLLGRFASPDIYSKSFPDWSPYAYVKNNPLSFIDPTGNIYEAPTTYVYAYNSGWYPSGPNYASSSGSGGSVSASMYPGRSGGAGDPGAIKAYHEQKAKEYALKVKEYWANEALKTQQAYDKMADQSKASLGQYQSQATNAITTNRANAGFGGAQAYIGPKGGVQGGNGGSSNSQGVTLEANAGAAVQVLSRVGLAAYAVAAAYLQVPGVQYTLRASKTGAYPVYLLGTKIPVNTIQLKAGDVWKIGETVQWNSATQKQWRYSTPELNSIGKGVYFKNEFEGTKQQILLQELKELWGYYNWFGQLPPGNKIFK